MGMDERYSLVVMSQAEEVHARLKELGERKELPGNRNCEAHGDLVAMGRAQCDALRLLLADRISGIKEAMQRPRRMRDGWRLVFELAAVLAAVGGAVAAWWPVGGK